MPTLQDLKTHYAAVQIRLAAACRDVDYYQNKLSKAQKEVERHTEKISQLEKLIEQGEFNVDKVE